MPQLLEVGEAPGEVRKRVATEVQLLQGDHLPNVDGKSNKTIAAEVKRDKVQPTHLRRKGRDVVPTWRGGEQ